MVNSEELQEKFIVIEMKSTVSSRIGNVEKTQKELGEDF
jgi:hypothetical protein